MKLFKRIAACLSAACVIAANGVPVSAYAETDYDDWANVGDCARVDYEAYERYYETLSEEELKKIEEKHSICDAVMNGDYVPGYENAQSARASDHIGLSGTFTMYWQERGNYCIPACVYSTLAYMNVYSPPQDHLHSMLGGAFTNIPECIKKYQDQHVYEIVKNPSVNTITSDILTDIARYNVPVFLRIHDVKKPDWPYDHVDGHCVLSNGICYDCSKILIADPVGTFLENSETFYRVESKGVDKYIDAICF